MGKTKLTVVSGTEPEIKPQKTKKHDGQAKKAKSVRVPGLKGGQRVVAVSAEPIETEKPKNEEVKKETGKKKTRHLHIRGKKYRQAQTKIETGKAYSVPEAAKLVKETSFTSFPGSVEFHAVLTKSSFNEKITLPFSSGKAKQVEIADDNTIEKLKNGKIDFDVLIASPDMMPKLIPFAKMLGPKGLMPNPKNGTLAKDPKKETEDFGGNTVEIKTEKKSPLVHLVIGKTTQPEKEIAENLQSVVNKISAKTIAKAVICASMGPSIKLDLEKVA